MKAIDHHLYDRGGRLYYRSSFPRSLTPFIPLKEIVLSLATNNIGQTITSTRNVFKKDETEFGKAMEKSFIRQLGEPDDYLKDNDIKEKFIENYAEHIEKTIEDLENIKVHELSSRLIE